MASKNLNQHIRSVILNKVLDNRYKKELEELWEQLRLVGVEILDDIIEPHKEAINSIPEMFLSKDTSWSFHIEGLGDCNASFYSGLGIVSTAPPRSEVERPVPATGYGKLWNHQYSYNVTNKELSKKYAKVQTKLAKLQELRRADLEETRAILASIRTVKQLKEHWPEVMDLLPEEIQADGSSRLLMVVTADLNKRLKLPVSDHPPKPDLKIVDGGKA